MFFFLSQKTPFGNILFLQCQMNQQFEAHKFTCFELSVSCMTTNALPRKQLKQRILGSVSAVFLSDNCSFFRFYYFALHFMHMIQNWIVIIIQRGKKCCVFRDARHFRCFKPGNWIMLFAQWKSVKIWDWDMSSKILPRLHLLLVFRKVQKLRLTSVQQTNILWSKKSIKSTKETILKM